MFSKIITWFTHSVLYFASGYVGILLGYYERLRLDAIKMAVTDLDKAIAMSSSWQYHVVQFSMFILFFVVALCVGTKLSYKDTIFSKFGLVAGTLAFFGAVYTVARMYFIG